MEIVLTLGLIVGVSLIFAIGLGLITPNNLFEVDVDDKIDYTCMTGKLEISEKQKDENKKSFLVNKKHKYYH